MTEDIITRKVWHEVLDDELDFVLVKLGGKQLVTDCVYPFEPTMNVNTFEDYCREIIMRNGIPDELSYNQILTILHSYLQSRWEVYKNGKSGITD